MLGLDDTTLTILILGGIVILAFLLKEPAPASAKPLQELQGSVKYVARVEKPLHLPAPAQPQTGLVLTRNWFNVCLTTDKHIMLVGTTGSGKSFLAKALAVVSSHYYDVTVLDPHAQPDTWGGLEAIGLGEEYAKIAIAIEILEAEYTRRFTAWGKGRKDFTPLIIFIDEFPLIKANVPQASEFIKKIARAGRKINMRLKILTQSMLVKSLGVEGEGDIRDNFDLCWLGNFANKKMPALGKLNLPFRGVFEKAGEPFAMDMSLIAKFANMAANLQSNWYIDKPFDGSEGSITQVPESFRPFKLKAGIENSELELRIIRTLWQSGNFTKSEIADLLGGNRQNRFKQINEVLDNEQ